MNRTLTLVAMSVAISIAMSVLITTLVHFFPRTVARDKEVEP